MKTWGFTGHHGTDKERTVLDLCLVSLKAVDNHNYETTVYHHKYIDEAGNYYFYRGSCSFRVKIGSHYRIKCTIHHSTGLNGGDFTNIKRLDYLEILYSA